MYARLGSQKGDLLREVVAAGRCHVATFVPWDFVVLIFTRIPVYPRCFLFCLFVVDG